MPEFWEIVFRSIVTLFTLLFLTRLMGKRQIAQATFFEYIVGVTIGSIAGFISADVDDRFLNGFVSMIIWALIPFLFSYLSVKSKTVSDIVEGNARVLIKDGKIMEDNLKKENYTGEELLEQLRLKDVFSIADVEYALLEQNGQISVLLKKENQPLTAKDLNIQGAPSREPQTVILDGNVMLEPLATTGLSKRWLHTTLNKMGIPLENVYIGQVDSYGQLNVDLYDDQITVPVPQEKPLTLSTLKKCQADLETFSLETKNNMAKKEYEKGAQSLKKIIEEVKPFLQS
ncbi:DUF421 domain-containing protein [Brevibacillus laterosporus]|uniref:DUF421 domain-containing protein n=1 Tax=Brevibacillus laterosporus TaxID=1465 RepID=UPI0002405283|nr:DUF421 domain-containing protein [Brevibacillus laterosporus]WPS85918.1 DUF421 domain-containing protein [Brevibacillus halotolerans]AUM65347.1 DUF421 domain-containing protein [Brevibacillus laterosporus]AYK08356.1 DUF421 domain-containing protein [Brevibacillus laterosporus]MCR8993606.1 DUF421 domain-containing protein [Brevibacillus laterosporus]PCN44080.1 hypothetical protein B9C88_11545 [Brevibacillus laterosporus]